ncbi:MAG: TerC family protein [Spirochaetota bacterium]|nr:TerC family protein [Spirochaetota bacterium]
MSNEILGWILFNCFIVIMLAIDLGIVNRKAHIIKIKEALVWSGIWISLALIFNVWIYYWKGSDVALQFFTGYVIEKSLSVDNLFVFLMIFSYFRVPDKYQHKILFWGILFAILTRILFIYVGVTLIERFHWVIYLFGAILILTAIKMLFKKEDKKENLEEHPLIKLLKRFMPVTDSFVDSKFFVRVESKRFMTPLFIVLMLIEFTDIVFAVDSIPAVIAITKDTFIIYTSNIFAILGLRSLYFALSGILRAFHYLHYGIVVILFFVGVKMLISELVVIPIVLSLGVIAGVIVLSIIISIIKSNKIVTQL